jgi:preprotein translocase subunit SecG
VLGGRQAATLLTRLSWWFGGSFLVLSFLLSIMSSRNAAPASVLEGEFQSGASTPLPTPVLPGAGAPEGTAAPAEGAAPAGGAEDGDGSGGS